MYFPSDKVVSAVMERLPFTMNDTFIPKLLNAGGRRSSYNVQIALTVGIGNSEFKQIHKEIKVYRL
jgi:hypothetical protein